MNNANKRSLVALAVVLLLSAYLLVTRVGGAAGEADPQALGTPVATQAKDFSSRETKIYDVEVRPTSVSLAGNADDLGLIGSNTRGASVHVVTLNYKNLGGTEITDAAVGTGLELLDGSNKPAVRILGSVTMCETKPRTPTIPPGSEITTCVAFAVPGGQTPKYVAWSDPDPKRRFSALWNVS